MKIGNEESLIPTPTRDGKVTLTYTHRVLHSSWREYLLTIQEARQLAQELIAVAAVSERATQAVQLAFALPSEQPDFSELDLGLARSLRGRAPQASYAAGRLISTPRGMEVAL